MEQIAITKRKGGYRREDSVGMRIAKDVSDQLDVLSEETGYTKTMIADLLLRKALSCVVVQESEM